MQRTFPQTIQTIKQLPSGIGDIIWSFYYKEDKTIRENQQKTINEFQNLICLTINNVDYDKFKKNKTFIKSAIEKKKQSVNLCIVSVFHPQYKKYCSHTNNGGTHLTSLDIFVGDMEEQFIVLTLGYKDRYVWKNNPKRNFIIKYLLYTYSQEYWMDNTCNGIIKSSGSEKRRCSCWLRPNCLHIRCSRHKFSQVKL